MRSIDGVKIAVWEPKMILVGLYQTPLSTLRFLHRVISPMSAAPCIDDVLEQRGRLAEAVFAKYTMSRMVFETKKRCISYILLVRLVLN